MHSQFILICSKRRTPGTKWLKRSLLPLPVKLKMRFAFSVQVFLFRPLRLTIPSNSDVLAELLHSVFGFTRFRVGQEAVCRAAIEGRDLLLVMPTGAGKSLCYQLPAIARGGTALVISPLIALMEDQATKLTALGLRVARQACADYLNESIQFLFIAPERLRVPGSPECWPSGSWP